MQAILTDFLVAVAAQVTAYYLCKWLNDHFKGQLAQRSPPVFAVPGGFALGEPMESCDPDRCIAYL